MKKGERYEILWLDTFSYNGWFHEEELKQKAKKNRYFQKSIGFFAGEYYGFYVLAMHRNDNEEFLTWGHPSWIPIGCAQTIKRI
jgi:hypothetical protein